MTFTSKIKLRNPNNSKQWIIAKNKELPKDVFLERSAMLNPADYEKITEETWIKFMVEDDKANHLKVARGTATIYKAMNQSQHDNQNSDFIEEHQDFPSTNSVAATEEAYIKLLNRLNYPFLYFDKSAELFSKAFDFKNHNRLGRPDFLICKKGLGLYAVDVQTKDIGIYHGEQCFTFGKKEVQEAQRFNRDFCLPWWWCFRTQGNDSGDWKMFSLYDFLEYFDEASKNNSPLVKKDYDFVAIPLDRARTFNQELGDSELFK